MTMSLTNVAPGTPGALDWEHPFLVEHFDNDAGIAVKWYGGIVFYRDANRNGVDNGDEVFVTRYSGKQTSYIVGSGRMTQLDFDRDLLYSDERGGASDPQLFTRSIRFGGSFCKPGGGTTSFTEEGYIAQLAALVHDATAGVIPVGIGQAGYAPMQYAELGGVIPPSPDFAQVPLELLSTDRDAYANEVHAAHLSTPVAGTELSLRGGATSIKIDPDTRAHRGAHTVAGVEWHYTRADGTTGGVVVRHDGYEEWLPNGVYHFGYGSPSFKELPNGVASPATPPCSSSLPCGGSGVSESIFYSAAVPSDSYNSEVDSSILSLAFGLCGQDHQDEQDDLERQRRLSETSASTWATGQSG